MVILCANPEQVEKISMCFTSIICYANNEKFVSKIGHIAQKGVE